MIESMISMNFRQSIGVVDWHTVFELILSFVQALAWPAVIVASVVVFRKQIKDKIGSLESAKGAGIEAKFSKMP